MMTTKHGQVPRGLLVAKAGWRRIRNLQLSHIIHPLLLAVKRHVRDNVDRGDVPRNDADALFSLPNPLAHLFRWRKRPVALQRHRHPGSE